MRPGLGVANEGEVVPKNAVTAATTARVVSREATTRGGRVTAAITSFLWPSI